MQTAAKEQKTTRAELRSLKAKVKAMRDRYEQISQAQAPF